MPVTVCPTISAQRCDRQTDKTGPQGDKNHIFLQSTYTEVSPALLRRRSPPHQTRDVAVARWRTPSPRYSGNYISEPLDWAAELCSLATEVT
jgi:hypothetical protein